MGSRAALLVAAILATPGLAGCIGGSATFAQEGMEDLETVSVALSEESYRWTPNAEHGAGVALEGLIVVYGASPADAPALDAEETDQALAEHEWVHLEVQTEQSVVLSSYENRTDVEVQGVYLLFENGTSAKGSPEALVCDTSQCQPFETSTGYDGLREQAEQALDAASA